MRLYISILAAATLTTTACDKKAEPAKPEPAKTEEPVKEQPTEAKAEEPKAEEPKAEEPKAEEPKKEEPVAAVAVDRTEGVQKAMEAWAAGKMEDCFAQLTDDAVRTNVGDPQHPEVKGKQAIIDHAKAMYANLSDVKLKAKRIIEAGDTQVVEYVISANMKSKGADGAEVVKAVTVPGAMVLAYNAEGKVTAVTEYVDQASMMMQAGAIPGLAEGFTAVAMPETTEVIKGDANPALSATYKAFGEKMKPDTIEAAIAEHIADDYQMVDFRTGKTIAKADMAAMMKGWMGMFADVTMAADKEITVGEYHVAMTTMTGTYKGGIEGAEAKDQKVTMHSLEVSRIVDGKFKSWAGYDNGMEIAAQLGMLGGAAEKPADPAAAAPAAEGQIGVAECDLYIAKMTECLGKLPDAAKGAFEQGMKGAVDGWKQAVAAGGDAAKGALVTGCKAAIDAAKQATGSLCPDVKWE